MHRPRSALIIVVVTLAALLLSGCARSAATPPERAPAYLIRDVAILDPERTTLSALQDVLIIDDRIIAVSDDAGRRSPGGARVIEGEGRVLAPGLIDMHVHIFDEAGLAASLAHGVTTVRNLGGIYFHLPMADRIEEGRLAGPRLITTGTIINQHGGRNANPLQTLISNPEDAREAVRRQHRQGHRHLKLYSNVSRENFVVILEEAQRLGMSVSGHPVEGTESDPMDISRTLEAGFRTVEHAESIIWHGLDDDTDPDRMQQLAREIAQSGVAVTPTLAVHANLARIVETGGAHLEREDMAAFNPVIASFQRGEYDHWASQEASDRPGMQAAYERFTGLLHDAGATIVLGSDAGVMATPHGVSAIEELELLVRSGLTPAEALQAGTLNAAAVLDLPAGRVAPGLLADLILLDADPREDFQILRRPAGVMANGIWYGGEDLDALRDASHDFGIWRTRTRMARHLITR